MCYLRGLVLPPHPSSLGWGNRWVGAMADDRRMVIALLVKYLRGGMLREDV
jgi:hypothetical protein